MVCTCGNPITNWKLTWFCHSNFHLKTKGKIQLTFGRVCVCVSAPFVLLLRQMLKLTWLKYLYVWYVLWTILFRSRLVFNISGSSWLKLLLSSRSSSTVINIKSEFLAFCLSCLSLYLSVPLSIYLSLLHFAASLFVLDNVLRGGEPNKYAWYCAFCRFLLFTLSSEDT